jgi:hypothetical protein
MNFLVVLMIGVLPCVVSYLYYVFSGVDLKLEVRIITSAHGGLFTLSFIVAWMIGASYPSGGTSPYPWAADLTGYIWLTGLASVFASLWLTPVRWPFHLLQIPSLVVAIVMLVIGLIVATNDSF